MPSFKTHIHGNLEIEVEIDNEGDFMDASVETKSERVYLDLDDGEIQKLMSDNVSKVHDELDEFKRNRDAWHKSVSYSMRKDK